MHILAVEVVMVGVVLAEVGATKNMRSRATLTCVYIPSAEVVLADVAAITAAEIVCADVAVIKNMRCSTLTRVYIPSAKVVGMEEEVAGTMKNMLLDAPCH